MRAFDVYVNGEKVYRAGLEGYAKLSAIVTSHLVDPESPTGKMIGPDIHPLDLMVGGFNTRTQQHFHWPKLDLKIGDVVKIKLIEADDGIDPPDEYIMPE